MSQDPLDRVTRLLVKVERLTTKVIAEKQNWHATPEEWAFLTELSELLRKELPVTTSNAANVALEFLLGAKFSLQTTQQKLRDEPHTL